MLSLAKAFSESKDPGSACHRQRSLREFYPRTLTSRENALTRHCRPNLLRGPSTALIFAHSAKINSAQDDNSI
jgi:hypothetical protein